MPSTDHLSMCPPEIKSAFSDLFRFATIQAVVNPGDRDHYASRFVVDPPAARQVRTSTNRQRKRSSFDDARRVNEQQARLGTGY